MSEYVNGDYISLKKNPYYYDADRVTVEELVFHLTGDDNSAYNAYLEEVWMLRTVFRPRKWQISETPTLLRLILCWEPPG